ncbi:MAG TPA: hypothetical protein VLK58_09210, partial [Conexibacter sp.]|nr:hypothetical protein [Conexibacter sp.]
AWSIAALMRSSATGVQSVCQGHNAVNAPAGYALQANSSLRIGAYAAGGGGNEPWSSNGFLPSGGFGLIAVTKAAGDATPAFHRHDFATGLWTPEPASQRLNTPASFAGGYLHFGAYGGSYRFRGDLAAIAVWAVELDTTTRDQLATVPTLARWAGVGSPRALWLFDQSSTTTPVLDLVGSAHEYDHTGTAVTLTSALPIPYRSPAAVLTGSGWSERNVLVRTSAGWTTSTSVGVL